jgi:benzaldehyde dehydrogenase (NAD)
MTLLDEAVWRGRIQLGGEWVTGAGGDYPVIEPATGKELGRMGAATPADVTIAAANAVAAQREWAALPHSERAAVLRRAGDLWSRHAAEISDWNIREVGAIPAMAGFALHVAAEECYEAAGLPSRASGEIVPSEEPRLSMVRRVPAGVVAEAGLPPGVLQVLPGGPDVGEALVTEPAVRVISFTGSTAAGRRVGELAGRLLKRAHLELGGNSALVVLEDADVDKAVGLAAFGSFFHQGQICMTTGRHIVHERIYDEFVDRLAAKASGLPVGDPAAGEVALGPVIDAGQRDKVHALVTASRDAGARVAAGGEYHDLFYRPTVLAEVPVRSPAFAEEVFGPVAPVTRFADLDEAVGLAGDTEYGLSLGIVTTDVLHGLAVADRIPTGIVHINDQTVSDEANVPFGGVGASGTGARFGGAAANIEAFTETRWVTLRSEPPRYPF